MEDFKVKRALLLLCIPLAWPAYAGGVPEETGLDVRTSARIDGRIKQPFWIDDGLIRVDTSLKFITSIEFHEREEIQAVLAGDSASFDIVRLKRGNVLSIKPVVRKARTNIIVYTDNRTYVLDVREIGRRNLTHRVKLRYHADEAQVEHEKVIPRPAEGEGQKYYAAGGEDFRPINVWDDGKHTYFEFDPNARRPAIFWNDDNGDEHTVNVVQLTGRIVKVTRLGRTWTLRIGENVVCVVFDDGRTHVIEPSILNPMSIDMSIRREQSGGNR